MRKIAAECPHCRLIDDLPASCVLLLAGDGNDSDRSSASWICDACHELVALPIGLTTLIELVIAGASVLDTTLYDPRPVHPETAIGGPAFTRDELLEFHERLSDDAWLALVLSTEC